MPNDNKFELDENYLNSLSRRLQMFSNSLEDGRSIDVMLDPDSMDKLENISIPLEEGEIVCDHCFNKEICKLYSYNKEANQMLNDLDFHCGWFWPDELLKLNSNKGGDKQDGLESQPTS